LGENKWQVGPVKLADGDDAFIDAINDGQVAFRYTGRVKLNDQWIATGWDENGRRMFAINNSPNNLAPPPKKKVRVQLWVNVYPGDALHVHKNKVDAESGAGVNRIACKKIDIEVEEGEGL
jgi:hypothetical protein